MEQSELPVGFGMALAQHPEALRKFAQLSGEQRAEILRRAHAASSKSDMQTIVSGLGAPE